MLPRCRIFCTPADEVLILRKSLEFWHTDKKVSIEIASQGLSDSCVYSVMKRGEEMRIVLAQSTMQVQRENLDKENSTLKADLEQMQWLQEQNEQMQEKVLKLIQQVVQGVFFFTGTPQKF